MRAGQITEAVVALKNDDGRSLGVLQYAGERVGNEGILIDQLVQVTFRAFFARTKPVRNATTLAVKQKGGMGHQQVDINKFRLRGSFRRKLGQKGQHLQIHVAISAAKVISVQATQGQPVPQNMAQGWPSNGWEIKKVRHVGHIKYRKRPDIVTGGLEPRRRFRLADYLTDSKPPWPAGPSQEAGAAGNSCRDRSPDILACRWRCSARSQGRESRNRASS